MIAYLGVLKGEGGLGKSPKGGGHNHSVLNL